MNHIPVLRDESIDGLAIKSGDIVVDGTLGGGGHTFEIIKRFMSLAQSRWRCGAGFPPD